MLSPGEMIQLAPVTESNKRKGSSYYTPKREPEIAPH